MDDKLQKNEKDLIDFSDPSTDFSVDEPVSPPPDLQRVYLSEIQYYRNPNFTAQNQFFYQPVNEKQSLPKNENETQNKANRKLEVWKQLKEAGVLVAASVLNESQKDASSVDTTDPNSDTDLKLNTRRLAMSITAPKSPVKVTSFNSLLRTQDLESSLNYAPAVKDQVDLIWKNFDEFEQDNNVRKHFECSNMVHDTNGIDKGENGNKNKNLLLLRNSIIKSLSREDLLDLEIDLNVPEHTIEDVSLAKVSSKPPPRPALPKDKRFSCPAMIGAETAVKEDDIFFNNDLFQKAEERNEEVEAFCKSISKLRKLYKYNHISTNPGYVSPTVMKCNTLIDTFVDISVYLEPFPESVKVQCKLCATSAEVISWCLPKFKSENIEVLNDEYVLKFIGLVTYLDRDVRLCDYVRIQDCFKHNQKLEFSLLKQDHLNVEFARDFEDDDEDCHGLYFKHFFDVPSSLSISEQGLNVLLDIYNNEAAKLIKDISTTYEAQYVPDPLIQATKVLCNSLACVELFSIQKAINMLLSLKRSNKTIAKALSNGRYTQYLNPMHFDKKKFYEALEMLTAGVYSLIELYCKSFQTEFTVLDNIKQNNNNTVYERVDPRTLTDNFVVHLSTVHRLPVDWECNYEHYEMEVGLYYGGKCLCPAKQTVKKKLCIGFYKHIQFRELLEFNIAVKRLPRETKIGYILHGISEPKKGTDGKTVLGWACLNIYDYQGFLLSGSKLFGLLTDIEFNPVATCVTNYIQRSETAIVKVDYQVYHTEVLFPEPVLVIACITPESKHSRAELKKVKEILKKDPTLLSQSEKYLIWEHRFDLCHFPQALIYVIASIPSWDSEHVLEVHTIIHCWEKLKPHDALELLQADFPDKTLRETAVLWLSDISNDDLCDYLPSLVQALKYEAYHNSALARFLIKRALMEPRVAHFLFWHLKYYTGDLQFCQRFQIVLSGLLSVIGARLRDQFSRQDTLLVSLQEIAQNIKEERSGIKKLILKVELEKLNHSLKSCIRLPLQPAVKFSSFIIETSSYFNSNTVPLKLALKNVDPHSGEFNTIFKIGDDLRKDLVTLLMFRVMNKLWLQEGLDLKMMLYNVLPSSPSTGLIEIVPNASTFREIHVQHGLTGSFKDNSLALWLQRYNSTEAEYRIATNNFTASAAGYCVGTYLLGIGDRHNDNIMLTKNGHLFHIDFSKFLGDVQKFGHFRRDRVPFVLTPDMAYVINNGVQSSQNFQRFIEYCCSAFNIIRCNMKLFLNLLGLMVYSGISYLSRKEDLLYIRQALQLHLTDDEATMFFTRLIESSLSSRSTQLNFFIHNIAQMKNVTETLLKSSRSSPLFSFSNKVHNSEEDGEIISARVVDFQKRYLPEKHYVFVINVLRSDATQPHFVFRRYEDFQELHAKLSYIFNIFNGVILPELPPRVLIGRSQIREVAVCRRVELDKYLFDLTKLLDTWKSEIVYTFLHSYIQDIEQERRFGDFVELLAEGRQSRIGGEIKLSMLYKNNCFNVLVMHVKNLIPRRIQGLAYPYVKLYLLPDPIKYSKRKTKISRKTLNPTFNESLTFDVAIELIQRRVLQVTVWDHDSLSENEFLGGINFYLSTFDLKKQRTDWFTLSDIGLNS